MTDADVLTLPVWPTVAETDATKAETAADPVVEPMADASDESDYGLTRRAAAGDTSAFEVLYERHSRRVYSLCLRMTQNPTEAEDLAQDVFVQLFRKVGMFRGESQFTTWLHRMTVNQVLMHFRKRGVKLEHTSEDGELPTQTAAGTEDARRMPIVDRIALDRALSKLPPGYRTVFVLHDVEGYEHEEIARLLGCAPGTSKSQLHKARLSLRKLLKRQSRLSAS